MPISLELATAPRRRKRRRSQKSFLQAMFGLETLQRSRRRRGQAKV